MMFWIITLLMLLGGLVLLAPALLRRGTGQQADGDAPNIVIARERLAELEAEHAAGRLDSAVFEQARDELEKGLLLDMEATETATPQTSRKHGGLTLVALAVMTPLLAVGLYLELGAPQHVDVAGPGVAIDNPHASEQQPPAPSMDEMLTMLQEKSQQEPDNPEVWFMLGRVQAAAGNYQQAAGAYEKLVELSDRHPVSLIVLADVLAMTQQGRVSGRPYQLVQEALEQDPQNVTALWLAGKAESEQRQYAAAIDYWQRALQGVSDQQETQNELRALIEQARDQAAAAGIELPAAQPDVTTSSGPRVTVNVMVSSSLMAQLEPDDVLYIFARDTSGSPMPLAAIRRSVRDLPVSVVIDDSALLRPGTSLQQLGEIDVAARVSRSGQPAAQSGDIESTVLRVSPAEGKEVDLLLDRLVP
jgi:cytochrome c-type biogenesis protein CcmH